ncbi:hypothetical protein BV898_19442 [Hypsibius exemplaris]|uniref:Uncharacterized protein n=1 Tax=Hypsibius exemplaris TaxID=2072580 RepID=A0A9X6RPG1_HYPEX|nr:hypothetical protein BV898_19442 [Hypsibius exemplaris]
MTAKLYTCLDYSIEPEQILRLRHADSIFNNDEICRKYLSPRLLACETKSGKGCSVHHLVSINMFARNYYLCSESIHGDTVHILQDDAYLREYDASAGPSIYTQSKHLFYICSIIVVWTNLLTQNTD